MKGPKSQNATIEIFFNSASGAALSAYQKNGRIPVAVSALVKNGKNYDLIPIGAGLPEMDVRSAQYALDEAVKPLITYVNENKDSYPVVFFLSVTAEGMARDLDSDETEDVSVIINAARTGDKKGKTAVYKIVKKPKLSFVKLIPHGSEDWVIENDEEDLPATLAQNLLDMVWRSFIIGQSMSSFSAIGGSNEGLSSLQSL